MKIGLHSLLSECHKILFLHVDSCIMCIDIYAYSCLKLLSNRPEVVLNPCSNHEIRVPFEHGFQPKMRIAGRTLFQQCYPVLRCCPFQTFVKELSTST